jgi:hypothetical protein
MYIDGQVIASPGPSNPQATGHGPVNGGGIFQYSTDGGATFTPSVNGLHADSHAIAISKSDPKVLYTGNDGGVWTTSNVTKKWKDINTKGFSATQFESIAVHPRTKRSVSAAPKITEPFSSNRTAPLSARTLVMAATP